MRSRIERAKIESKIIQSVVTVIPMGAENAIHLKELSELLHMNDGTVKRYIKLARQQGYRIISDTKGYWLSESKEDWRKWRNMMHRQAISRLEVIKPINDRLKDYDGQIDLTDMHKGDT